MLVIVIYFFSWQHLLILSVVWGLELVRQKVSSGRKKSWKHFSWLINAGMTNWKPQGCKTCSQLSPRHVCCVLRPHKNQGVRLKAAKRQSEIFSRLLVFGKKLTNKSTWQEGDTKPKHRASLFGKTFTTFFKAEEKESNWTLQKGTAYWTPSGLRR